MSAAIAPGQKYEQAIPPPGYPPLRLEVVLADPVLEGWWFCRYHTNPAEVRPVQAKSLRDDRLWKQVVA